MQNARQQDRDGVLGFFGSFDGLGGRQISQRAYYGTIAGLTFVGFLVMAITYAFTLSPQFALSVANSPQAILVTTWVAIGASFLGIILQAVGAYRIRNGSNSLALMIIGYVLIVCSLGFSVSFIMNSYDLGSIMGAFVGTAAIGGVMTLAGFLFPGFFQRIYGILIGCLIGVIIAQIIMLFMGVDQSWINWVVLLIFAGLIAVDTYRATRTEPTWSNAIFWATNIYLDLINIFIRLLAIFGDRR